MCTWHCFYLTLTQLQSHEFRQAEIYVHVVWDIYVINVLSHDCLYFWNYIFKRFGFHLRNAPSWMLRIGLFDKSRSLGLMIKIQEIIHFDDCHHNPDEIRLDLLTSGKGTLLDGYLSWVTWEKEYPGMNLRLLWLKKKMFMSHHQHFRLVMVMLIRLIRLIRLMD